MRSPYRLPAIKFFLFTYVLFLILPASAQDIQEQVEVKLVQVDVVAKDSKGNVVTDLKAEDFVLKEGGKPQQVKYFYNSSSEESRYPLTISFLVDTSASMQERVAGMTRIEIAIKAAELVMSQLKEGDMVELIEFNEKPDVLVPFTSDFAAVQEAFKSVDFRQANTAMRDSVVFAMDRIKDRSGRKVVVIFSDGMDSASKSIEEDAIDAIKKSDATFIAFFSELATLRAGTGGIGTGNSPSPMGHVRARIGEDAMRMYAEMSGGQFFSFRKEPELLKAMESFRNFIKSQYTLAYTPAAAAGKKQKAGYRKIKVECKRKDVKLVHREGYWAD